VTAAIAAVERCGGGRLFPGFVLLCPVCGRLDDQVSCRSISFCFCFWSVEVLADKVCLSVFVLL
jgi:hypothetical protein